MRIGIDARVLMNKKYSGVSWYAFNLFHALFALDAENEYVLFYNSNKAVAMPEFDFPNVSYKPFRYSNKLFNLALLVFGRPRLDKLIGGCDVFFVPNLHFVSWSGDCRKIVVVHDLSFLAYPAFFTWKQRLWHKLILDRRILQQADAIIVPSESTKRDLTDLLAINKSKISAIALGTGISQDSRLSGVPSLPLPEKYFLFFGTIEPRKNLLSVLRAIEQLPPDFKLVVAGQWGWKFVGEKKLFDANPRIIKLGYVAESDKVELFRGATALVYPSFYEGFGLPILEAMSLGCPVIAGNNSSQGEVLGDAGLLVDPFDINAIAQAMLLLDAESELRQEFIGRGLERAKLFNWAKTAAQTKAVIDKLRQ